MLRIVAVVLVFLTGALLRAQERPATIVLDDGRTLAGTLVAIDLGSLRLRVGDEVLTLATESIRMCRFDGTEPAPAPTEPVRPESTPAAPAVEARTAAPAAPVAPAPVTAAPPARPTPAPPRTVRAPLPAPVAQGDEAAAPHDLRHQSRFRARLQAIDAAFPWLVPGEPTQWVSLSLLLFAFLSFVVHTSVTVVGADAPAFSRSMGIALWYLLTGLLQMAMVPSVHVATFSMLIGNTAMALFWLRNLFGVSRGGAMVALAVQLGFAVLGYGVLELVTSLMASIEPLPA